MNTKLHLIAAALLVGGTAAWGQSTPPPGGHRDGPGPMQPGGRPQGDPMAESFFPPELVMQNQKTIGLKEDQQTAIKSEMQKMMSRFTDLQWQQSAETEAMASLVKQDRPDEKQVLAQLDKLLSIENEIKRLHLGLLVKIKNTLTPEQQAKLRELKPQARPHPPIQRSGAGGQDSPHPQPPQPEGQ